MNLGLSPNAVAILRGVIMLAAALFQAGVIPTHIDGGGEKVAATLATIAVMLAAGDKTPSAVKQATEDVQIAQAEGRL